MPTDLLIDDFRRGDGCSALGTRWEGFSDQVMGGQSEMQMGYREVDGRRALNLRGQVRLENRGGFIQARLPLGPAGGTLDASRWHGIRLTVRGSPGPYFLHLKTRQLWLPWQYFRARIAVQADWREQFVPFSTFEGVATGKSLDVRSLKTIAIVAYGEAFMADVDVAQLAFTAAPAAAEMAR